MALNPDSPVQEVQGITEAQKQLIRAFMQGAIYAWVKNRPGEAFAVRDLMGGENFEWEGTPLFVLYQKHVDAGKDSDAAITGAAQDLGWLTKAVLAEDKRTFVFGKAGLVNSYRWVGNEP